MRTRPLFVSALVLLAAGCAGPDKEGDDTGSTSDPSDTADTDDTQDTDTDDSGDTGDTGDTGIPDDPVWTGGPALPDCTPQEGTSSLVVLSGVVLTPDGPVAGAVSYDRETALIDCVGDSCEAGADDTVVCTDGVIAPGLIDPHNHLQYNLTPPWQHDGLFTDRYDWRSDGDYYDYREAYDDVSDSYNCEIMKWAELRVLVGGGTSAVGSYGDACIETLVRNLDEGGGAHGFSSYDLDYSASTVTTRFDSGDGADITEELATGELDASLNHVAEGIGGSGTPEVDHMFAVGMHGDGQAYVHATDAHVGHLARMAGDGTAMVWSPRSNLDLYGQTSPADVALRMGVTVALGPDWTWSGSMNPHREMLCAHEYLQTRKAATPGDDKWDVELFHMVTSTAARVVGLDGVVGSLEAGMVADISVFAWSHLPYRSIVEADSASVRLVVLDGQALYGVPELTEPLAAAPEWCESVDPCGGETRSICVQSAETGDDAQTMHDLETILSSALATADSHPDHPYANELHGLFYCEDSRASCDLTEVAADDADGDGVTDGEDLCPDAWDPAQLDWDADGEGDACDPCAIIPGATAADCSTSATDWDGDGHANEDDGCPLQYDPDQTDSDGDDVGDACDVCPDAPNPGNGPCAIPLRALRDSTHPDHPPEDTAVTINDVVVTAVGPSGFHVQDPAESTYGGIYVYTSSSGAGGVSEGDLVTVTGTYVEYYDLSEITGPTVTVTGTATVPDPVVLDPCDIGTGGSLAEAYESMLVRVEDVSVTDENPDASAGDDYGEMEVDSCLRIDDGILDGYDRTLGTTYSFIQGPLHYAFSNSKVRPRTSDDWAVE